MNIINRWLADKKSLIFELGLLAFILFNKQFYTQDNYTIRMYLYVFCLVLIIVISRVTGIDKNKLGLISTNWIASLKQIVVPTAITCILIVTLHTIWPSLFTFSIHYPSKMEVFKKVLAYVVISVPIQELIFRGYFINRLKQVTRNRYLLILSSALIFSAIHAPFGISLVTIGSFLLGIFLADNFLRFRNLFTVMLAHGIVGLLFIYYINV